MSKKRIVLFTLAGITVVGLSVFGYFQREKLSQKLTDLRDKLHHEPMLRPIKSDLIRL